jgi:hypothetical protein
MPPGTARHIGLLGVHRQYFDLRPMQPQIEFPATGIAEACSMTMVASNNVAADISRTGSSAIFPSKAAASGSSNKMAAIAEVSITITAAAQFRHSR